MVVANSRATQQALLRNAPWLDAKYIRIVYNGINPKPFLSPPRKDLRALWELDRQAAVLGFVGQLDERKGIQELLQAFVLVRYHLPNLHLVMAGLGSLERNIRSFAVENGLERYIHVLGFQQDIAEVMKAIDCLVLPSWWEGFGIVLIEAMAAGKPVITTHVSSMPEIVQHRKTGLVVPVRNAEALAAAIRYIFEHPDIAIQWGEMGRERVLNRFTLENMLDDLEQVFQSAISIRKTKHGIV